MESTLSFDFPWVLRTGGVLAGGVLLASVLTEGRRVRGAWLRLLLVTLLRAVALGVVLFLAARPVFVAPADPPGVERKLLVLLDRSASMALEEGGQTRFEAAREFLNRELAPAARGAGIPMQEAVFAEDVQWVTAGDLARVKPEGTGTNLGGALASALPQAEAPPLAVVVLSDGVFQEGAETGRALSLLSQAGTPLVGIGFGSEAELRVLSLTQLGAPPRVGVGTSFEVSAMLEARGQGMVPPFDLSLMRNGQVIETRQLPAQVAPQTWTVNFPVSEEREGDYEYTVQLAGQASPQVRFGNQRASARVHVENSREVRVLYVQGGLTWDYKFVSIALKNDPTFKITGYTRTAAQSFFRQNVESAEELTEGFPSTPAEMAPYRVVVLSNIRPTDLTAAQQEVLARFVSERGGGVLMMGGADTFDSSWRGTRLEQLLPVLLAPTGGVMGIEKPFRMNVLPEALRRPVFAVSETRTAEEVWGALPTFLTYGRIDAGKPGAQVWAEHSEDRGPGGRRILMATQRFGAGITAVLAVQNFWRWRLAKDAEPAEYDRFWRQLFRYLASADREQVLIQCTDTELRAPMDVHVAVSGPASMTGEWAAGGRGGALRLVVEDPQGQVLLKQDLAFEVQATVQAVFRAEKAGLYRLSVRNGEGETVSLRSLDVPESHVELERTARDMGGLAQWAAVGEGFALKREDCPPAAELLRRIRESATAERRRGRERAPLELRWWMLAVAAGALSAEWLLRKRWNFS
ncbi:MAG: hypothetical protein RLZZ244_992 [Verrucomicrobiota bacterium]